jgi:uncharacterized membrane protein
VTNPVPHYVYGLIIVLPALMVAIACPLILGKVPPNPWYGLRTRRTMSSQALWYKANRMGGIYLILSTLAAVAIWGGLVFVPMAAGARPLLELLILVVCQGAAITVVLVRMKKM